MSSPSETLGRYQIIREIARSNDIVYEAWDPSMNRRVALKELAIPHGASEKVRQERLSRFHREAKAAGSLSHPNIVTVYEVGEDAGRAFIAMEYLEGQTLRQRIDAAGFIPQDEAVEIVCKVLEGLQYAHHCGVVHRDVKPDNVQLLPDGRVKITDFGIARLMFEPSLTMDGQIFGTPSYMSPEQVVGREIDARTDIWSCGVLLYESLTGQKPFTGDSVVAISHAIMHLDPIDPPQASFPIVQVIRRALDKSPSERWPSAQSMLKALRDAIVALKQDPTGAFSQPMPTQVNAGPPATTPWGPPLDPYHVPPPSSPPPVYGAPYSWGNIDPLFSILQPPPNSQPGAPYGQPYGTQSPNSPPPPLPYPPGWISPRPRDPLLSPAAAEFIRRTFMVIVIGGAILLLGFAGILALNKVAEKTNEQKINSMKARQLHHDSSRLSHPSERIRTLEQSVLYYENAIAATTNVTNKELLHSEISKVLMKLSEEWRAQGNTDLAVDYLQRAIFHADMSGDKTIAIQARQLMDSLSPK
jgi:hypothetical protein